MRNGDTMICEMLVYDVFETLDPCMLISASLRSCQRGRVGGRRRAAIFLVGRWGKSRPCSQSLFPSLLCHMFSQRIPMTDHGPIFGQQCGTVVGLFSSGEMDMVTGADNSKILAERKRFRLRDGAYLTSGSTGVSHQKPQKHSYSCAVGKTDVKPSVRCFFDQNSQTVLPGPDMPQETAVKQSKNFHAGNESHLRHTAPRWRE